MKRLICIFILSCVALVNCAFGMPQQVDSSYVSRAMDSLFLHKYDFVDLKADTIIDSSGSMASFYASLDSIDRHNHATPYRISIVHFGDSHIQGGFLTQTVMRHFAANYGTSGRGMVVPHRLSGKNEPRDYSIVSRSTHAASFVNQKQTELSLGVSGVSIKAPAGATYTIRALDLPEDELDYSFSRVIVFHDPFSPVITTSDESLMDEISGDDISKDYITPINLLHDVDSLDLMTYAEDHFKDGSIYGFSLENNRSGVIYHSLGVNGACFLHWGRNAQAAIQSEALAPNLIIVSLGSNEAAGSNFIAEVFTKEMDSFVSKLRAANPSTPILLTTPAEAMRTSRRVKKPNTNFEKVRRAIIDYGAANSLAVFDLYGATGAAGSAAEWKKSGLLSRDGIHYTADGYRLQGLLLYNALTRIWK